MVKTRYDSLKQFSIKHDMLFHYIHVLWKKMTSVRALYNTQLSSLPCFHTFCSSAIPTWCHNYYFTF